MPALTLDDLLTDYPRKEAEEFISFLAEQDPYYCSPSHDPVDALMQLEGPAGPQMLERVASIMIEHIITKCRKCPTALHRLFAARALAYFDCDGQAQELGEKTLLLFGVVMNPTLLTSQKRASYASLQRDFVASYVLLRRMIHNQDPSAQELNRVLIIAREHSKTPYSPASYQGTAIITRLKASQRYQQRLIALSEASQELLELHFSKTLSAMAEIGEHRLEYRKPQDSSIVFQISISTASGWSGSLGFKAVFEQAKPKRTGRPTRTTD